MALLDDIIHAGIDSSHSLSTLLRQCLLLAHELKNERLKSWANQELNGYPNINGLPDYRIMYVGAKGHFAGGFGAELRNYPIPSLLLEERHRDFAEKIYLTDAIRSYESATSDSNRSLGFEWPADLCLYYQMKFISRYALVSARQSVANGSIIGMLDTIRNRTLNMALEIREEIGGANDLGKISSTEAQKISETITQNIFNGPAYFASGEASLNISTNTNQTIISVGNRDELDRVLLRSGLPQPEIQQLTKAIEADGKTMGSNVSSWVKRAAPKVLAGGVKIGSTVAQTLLTEWLKQYYGLN